MFVFGFRTCSFWQFLVPIGGTTGVWIGRTAGGTMGHIVGEQIGFKSIELVQMGVTLPFTHRQAQLAKEEAGCKSATAATSTIADFVRRFILRSHVEF
jgi:hypothetical protein